MPRPKHNWGKREKLSLTDLRFLPSWDEVRASAWARGLGISLDGASHERQLQLRRQYQQDRARRAAFNRLNQVAGMMARRGLKLTPAARVCGIATSTVYYLMDRYEQDGIGRMIFAAENGTWANQPMEFWQAKAAEHRARVAGILQAAPPVKQNQQNPEEMR